MNAQIKLIAQRLRGLREALDLTISEAAERCNISEQEYAQYESGASDIPMSFICQVAQTFEIETTALISGDDPSHKNLFRYPKRNRSKRGTYKSV